MEIKVNSLAIIPCCIKKYGEGIAVKSRRITMTI